MLFIELTNDAHFETIYVNPEYIVSMVHDEQLGRTEVTLIGDGCYDSIVDTPDEIITKIKEARLKQALGLK